MKAIVQDSYGTAGALRLAEAPDPVPGAGEVLVSVRAAGVDPGVWHFVTGLPYVVRPASGLRGPRRRVPGRDVAGVVAAVGEGVTRFEPGDEVFGAGDGTYAELAVARADRLEPKPANLSFEQAAAVPTSAMTALQALRRGDVAAGQRVLITGAGGGIGTFAVQLAKGLGAHVTGVCGTDKVDLVRSLGADDVVDYSRAEVTQRYDVVVDTAGSRSLTQLRRMLTPKGTLVIAGGEGGGKWVGTFHRSLRAPFVSLFVGQRLRQLTSLYKEADARRLAELLASGELVPVVSRTLPLSAAAEAIDHLEAGHTAGKQVLTV
jgi:NADPH:quinone reductase-like Zn-dependent oxidoreductase